MIKSLSFVFMFIFFSFLSHAQEKRDTIFSLDPSLLDSLRQFQNEMDSDNFTNIKLYKKLQQELIELIERDSIDLTPQLQSLLYDSYGKELWKVAMYSRNGLLQELFVENSEITHIAYARMKVEDTSSSVINANINLNFFVLPKHWRVGVVINPKFKMRMFLSQPSAPIRTPSNMVGITVFTHITNKYNPYDFDSPWLNRYKIVSASFFHHSNGQDKGSYNRDGTINIRTGNFAVNFLKADFMIGRNKIIEDTTKNYFIKLGYQHDFIIDEFTPKGERKELEGDYGQDRINFEFSFSKVCPRKEKVKNSESLKESDKQFWRAVIDGSLVFPTNGVRFDKFSDCFNIEGKIYWKIPYTPNFMLMSSLGWLGHDYYNIYFNESTFIFRIGIAAAFNIGSGTTKN